MPARKRAWPAASNAPPADDEAIVGGERDAQDVSALTQEPHEDVEMIACDIVQDRRR